MEENFNLQVQSTSGSITTNFTEIEAKLKKSLEDYKDYEVTEETLKQDSEVLSNLRKFRKDINDRKIAVHKEYEKEYLVFENDCKKLLAMVDGVIEPIADQIKVFKENEIANKKEHLHNLYTDNIDNLESYLPFEKTLGEKWQNKSYDDKTYLYDLSEKRLKIRNDLEAISSLNSEIESEVIETYRKNDNNLSMAIARNAQYLSDKAKIAEQTPKVEPPVEVVQKKEIISEVKESKTVKLVVSVDDLKEIKELLDFSGIEYVVED